MLHLWWRITAHSLITAAAQTVSIHVCLLQGVGASQLSEGGRVPWREDFLFAQGIVEGEHQVSWEDGGVYYGEWSAGRPHGRGIFVWPTGVCWQLPASSTGGWQA